MDNMGAQRKRQTRFALQLGKYLTHFGRVAYNSLEEGASVAMRTAFWKPGCRIRPAGLYCSTKNP